MHGWSSVKATSYSFCCEDLGGIKVTHSSIQQFTALNVKFIFLASHTAGGHLNASASDVELPAGQLHKVGTPNFGSDKLSIWTFSIVKERDKSVISRIRCD